MVSDEEVDAFFAELLYRRQAERERKERLERVLVDVVRALENAPRAGGVEVHLPNVPPARLRWR